MSRDATASPLRPLGLHDSIPVLTEVFEICGEEAQAAQTARATREPDHGPETALDRELAGTEPAAAEVLAQVHDERHAVRAEVTARVLARFRGEWPSIVQAQTEAVLQDRFAVLVEQVASELTRSLESKLVAWLDATLEDIARQPDGN